MIFTSNLNVFWKFKHAFLCFIFGFFTIKFQCPLLAVSYLYMNDKFFWDNFKFLYFYSVILLYSSLIFYCYFTSIIYQYELELFLRITKKFQIPNIGWADNYLKIISKICLFIFLLVFRLIQKYFALMKINIHLSGGIKVFCLDISLNTSMFEFFMKNEEKAFEAIIHIVLLTAFFNYAW